MLIAFALPWMRSVVDLQRVMRMEWLISAWISMGSVGVSKFSYSHHILVSFGIRDVARHNEIETHDNPFIPIQFLLRRFLRPQTLWLRFLAWRWTRAPSATSITSTTTHTQARRAIASLWHSGALPQTGILMRHLRGIYLLQSRRDTLTSIQVRKHGAHISWLFRFRRGHGRETAWWWWRTGGRWDGA